MTSPRANLALFSASAALLGAVVLWPALVLGPREARSRASAEAALDRIAARERSLAPARGYVAFGPGPGEPEAALPGLGLGPAGEDFALDASPDAAGALRLRAVSRPEAILGGRVVPLLLTTVLAGPAELGHEEAAGRPGPAQAAR